jgi:anti-sigma factor RsiW
VAKILPAAVEQGAAVELSVQRHIESCLRCQAELARYRRMLRGLQMLRTRYLEPAPGLLAQTLAAIEQAGERQAVRSILSGRRLAFAGAIGGAAVAATAAATAVMLAHRSRRRTVLGGAPSA